MNVFRLAIVLSDEALAQALARAIAKEYPTIHAVIGEAADADFTIRDEFLGAPAPVREIVDRALAASGKTFSFPERASSCPVTAFTSGGGGRGVSSCAKLYAAFRAQEGRRVLLLSFDPYLAPTDEQAGMGLLRTVLEGSDLPLKAACVCDENGCFFPAQSARRNLFHELTEEDAARFLTLCEDSGEWDEIVLDVPRALSGWRQRMNQCERQVVLCCEQGLQGDADMAAWEELSELGDIADAQDKERPFLVRFTPGVDETLTEGACDLYGQLGCEVRELAQRLALC